MGSTIFAFLFDDDGIVSAKALTGKHAAADALRRSTTVVASTGIFLTSLDTSDSRS